MADHLVTITAIEQGYPVWSFECRHGNSFGDRRWDCTTATGEPDPAMAGECWLKTWWDELGSELLDITGPITALPIPVRPNSDWSFDDGGSLVRDTVAEAGADNLSAEALALIGQAALDGHTKTFRTVSDEVYGTNAVCECGQPWPCRELHKLRSAGEPT